MVLGSEKECTQCCLRAVLVALSYLDHGFSEKSMSKVKVIPHSVQTNELASDLVWLSVGVYDGFFTSYCNVIDC